MTRNAIIRLLSTFFAAMCICSMPVFGADREEHPRKIMLASTIGPIDAGIVGALGAAFTKKSGVAVEHIRAGTSQALKMAETGKYDLVLVHARALEEKFVANGYGTKRYDLMYNDFVILGPGNDPAGIRERKKCGCCASQDRSSPVLLCYERGQIRNPHQGIGGLEEGRD